MYITPKTNLLKSLRGERINYPMLIGEGIDNALDAGATVIELTIAENVIDIVDNGVGITRDRIEALFSLGDHGPMSTTQLGRFGIGIKHQAVNAGNILKIVSTSHDGRVRVQVDWREVLKSGRWEIADPKWLPVAVNAPTGTTISIADLRRPPKISMEQIRQEVALQFRPAIADGKRITINRQQIELLIDPDLTDEVDCQFSFSGGRTARLHAGILVHASKLSRVHVAYRHRVIMPGSTLGCGEYGGLRKMFARLQLSGPWHLAKFKDDLTDEAERDDLEESVNEALRPILDKCASESITAHIAQLSKAINEMVKPEYQPARPHKNGARKGRTASEPASGKAGIVASDKSSDGGPARAKRTQRDTLLITFEGDVEIDGIGVCTSSGKAKRVDLSKDHPYVADLIALRDETLAARTILALAVAIFEQRRTGDQEDMLDSFGKRIANMLAINETAQRTANG